MIKHSVHQEPFLCLKEDHHFCHFSQRVVFVSEAKAFGFIGSMMITLAHASSEGRTPRVLYSMQNEGKHQFARLPILEEIGRPYQCQQVFKDGRFASWCCASEWQRPGKVCFFDRPDPMRHPAHDLCFMFYSPGRSICSRHLQLKFLWYSIHIERRCNVTLCNQTDKR